MTGSERLAHALATFIRLLTVLLIAAVLLVVGVVGYAWYITLSDPARTRLVAVGFASAAAGIYMWLLSRKRY